MAENLQVLDGPAKVVTVQDAFIARLEADDFIHFKNQEKITARAAEIWCNREKVTGDAAFVPAPVSGFFPDQKDIWAVVSGDPVNAEFPYLISPAVDDFSKLVSLASLALQLQDQGKSPALVTNFVLEQRMERDVNDPDGKLHQANGQPLKGTEMALLRGVAAYLQVGFPRGVMQVDGHGLGFEYWASKYGLPLFTMTSMPLLFDEAVNHDMIKDRRSVTVSGDVGGVMLMNMMTELVESYGLEVKPVYGEKRSEEVFTSWGRSQIKGAQVIFGDDVISSGKTVFRKVLAKAFEYGAKNAVVLVPHTDLVQRTIDNLNDCPLPVTLVVGDTFPVRPEVADSVAANGRLLRVPVFDAVMKAAEMDKQNLLADVFTNKDTQVELLRQTGLGIFPPYVEKYRTVSDMLK